MKNNTTVALLTLILLVVLTSCNKDDAKDQTFNYIDLEFFEQFSPEGTELYFNFKTLESFPCSNFTLSVAASASSGQKEIRITDIEVPDVCVTTMGPATYLLPLGAANKQTTHFTLWVNDNRHDFQLKTEAKTISVTEGEHFEDHLFFAFDSIMRIPLNTVWGYVVFSGEGNGAEIWTQMLEKFYHAGAKEMILPDGNYYYFDVRENKILFENVKSTAHTFYFHFDQPIQQLIDIYENSIANQQESELQLRLFDTKGERFVL